MDRGAEYGGRCGSTMPITLRITALMFLDPYFMIGKHRMEIGFSVASFIQLPATLGANIMARCNQF